MNMWPFMYDVGRFLFAISEEDGNAGVPGTCGGTVVGGAAGARAGGFIVRCTGLGSPVGRAFWFSMSCDIKFEIILDNSSVAALFAVLIAVYCAIKSRNIDVVSSDATRGVASWFNAVISVRRSSFCFVIFSISSDKAVRRSFVDTPGAAALACRASCSPRTVESSMVNCATFAEKDEFIRKLLENYCFVLLTNRAPPQISDNRPDMRHRAFAESCWNCSDVYCVAAGVAEAVGSGALCNLASAVVIAIFTAFTDRMAFLQALHVTINGILELGVRERGNCSQFWLGSWIGIRA